jgi:hypothetical protein
MLCSTDYFSRRTKDTEITETSLRISFVIFVFSVPS